MTYRDLASTLIGLCAVRPSVSNDVAALPMRMNTDRIKYYNIILFTRVHTAHIYESADDVYGVYTIRVDYRYCYGIAGRDKRRGGGQIFVAEDVAPATLLAALKRAARSAGNEDTINDKTVSKRPTRVRPLTANRIEYECYIPQRRGESITRAFITASVRYTASNIIV